MRIVAELAMVGAWSEGVVKGAAEVGKVLKGLVSTRCHRVHGMA